jgi:hypothetical protein
MILLLDGRLKIWNKQRRLLASVPRSMSRLYELELDAARPVCLAAQGGNLAWRWHAAHTPQTSQLLEPEASRGGEYGACDATD